MQNLLDMTRLGYGALQPKREWSDLREIAGRALKQLSKVIAKPQLNVDIPDSLPAIFVDPVLIEQVMVNILDNAAKYTKLDGVIGIGAEPGGQRPGRSHFGQRPRHSGAVAQRGIRHLLPCARRRQPGGGNGAWPVHLPWHRRGAWRPHLWRGMDRAAKARPSSSSCR